MPAGVVKPGTEAKWEEAKKSARKQLSPGSKRYWALVNYIYGKMTHRKEAMAEYAYTDSKGQGHLPIGDAGHVRNALARFNQTFFESAAKARAAWGHIMSAARKFGIKHEGGMPRPKVKEPSPGYKKASAEDLQVSTFAVAIEGDEAPEWIELMPAGEFSAVDGRGPFENDDPEEIIQASTKLMPPAGMVLDYEHSTDFAAPEGRPSPAAGWIKEFQVKHGAIFARIEWTQRAAEALKAKEYRYISPVFEHDKENRVERILRAALTNNPALTELPAIASAKTTMAKNSEMPLSDKVRHFEAMFPPRDEEDMSAYHKRLMKKIQAAHADADEEAPMDEEEAAGALKDWAGEEEKEHGMDGNGDEGEPPVPPGQDEDEDEMTMARRHEEEMKGCLTSAEREDATARHKRESEDMARRKKEMAMRPGQNPYEAPAPKEEARRREAAGYEETSRMSTGKGKDNRVFSDVSRQVDRVIKRSDAAHSEVETLRARLMEVEKRQARATAVAAVDEAIKLAKLLPAQRDWGIEYATTNLAGFKTFVAKQPTMLTPSADGTFTGKVPESTTEIMTAREMEVCQNLGVSKESFVVAKKERLSYGVHFGKD